MSTARIVFLLSFALLLTSCFDAAKVSILSVISSLIGDGDMERWLSEFGGLIAILLLPSFRSRKNCSSGFTKFIVSSGTVRVVASSSLFLTVDSGRMLGELDRFLFTPVDSIHSVCSLVASMNVSLH